ncbi:AAA family ATPase [Ammoniphilus resinae]|uniref:MoxR-like ATPase n=1 Tax=Ammoniphilus resinae TaxID=861532 RepID=A0ABS4GNG9_9BACL|nr:AAA family ATPase [Ammoniphilus resinae]MBP1931791.1 MoxR-like ATPase [Ammoniphilus resinae]
MSQKITFKSLNVPMMTVEAWKEKIPAYVQQVEKNPSGNYKITFRKTDHPGYIIAKDDKVRFIHYCEANSKGQSCAHTAIALATASILEFKIDLNGFPTAPITLPEMEKDLEDVSELVGVVPPVKPSKPAATSSVSGTSTTAAAPAKTSTAVSKRDWKDGWNEIQDYLQDQGVTPRMILEIRQRREQICDTVEMTTMAVFPKKPKTPYIGEMLGRSLRHILMGKDLLLVGDKGSGKDTLIATLSWIFSLPLYLQIGNGDETKESVVGENTLVQGARGMEVQFKKSPFATSVEKGGISSYPELNMLSGDVTSIFHSVLDENRQLSTPEGVIERHADHIFIGSINVGDQYSGVKKLNGAFKDRLSILKLPYVQDFRTMLIEKTGLKDAHALDFLEKTKKAIDDLVATEQQGEESKTIRGYIDAAVYLQAYGITMETKTEALEDFIIHKSEDFEEQMALRDMIRQKVWSDFPMTIEEEQYINGMK